MGSFAKKANWFFSEDGDFFYNGTYEEFSCTGRYAMGVYGRAYLLSDGRALIRLENEDNKVYEFGSRADAEEYFTIF